MYRGAIVPQKEEKKKKRKETDTKQTCWSSSGKGLVCTGETAGKKQEKLVINCKQREKGARE